MEDIEPDPVNLDFQGVRYHVFFTISEDMPDQVKNLKIMRRCDEKWISREDFIGKELTWIALHDEALACAHAHSSSYEHPSLCEEVLEY